MASYEECKIENLSSSFSSFKCKTHLLFVLLPSNSKLKTSFALLLPLTRHRKVQLQETVLDQSHHTCLDRNSLLQLYEKFLI